MQPPSSGEGECHECVYEELLDRRGSRRPFVHDSARRHQGSGYGSTNALGKSRRQRRRVSGRLRQQYPHRKRHRRVHHAHRFRHSGERTGRRILDDIPIEDDDGEVIIIPSGTTVETFFDLDIYQLNYSYSFFQDERIDLAAGIGVYIMPIDEGEEKFTAPLPVINLRMDIALTPKWFIRTGAQVFYLEYENFTGSILEFRTALEYNPWKHVGIGVGFDTFGFRLEADGEDWPGIDLKGNVEFNYAGLQLYLRMFY
jgi:hypothetical protein